MAKRSTPRPVTAAERERVRQLRAAGKGRNEIARDLDRPAGTITTIARGLGLSFDRAATAAATQARQDDLAALRTQLAYDLTTDAMKLRAQLWQPAIIYNFGGKDNTYEERSVPEPPTGDKRNLMLTAGAAIDRSLKLAPPVDDQGAGEIGSLLTGLFDRLRDRHGDG